MEVQDHSRSSMLTFLRSRLPVLVMISSMSVPICNHFHLRRANNGRITLFKGVPLFLPLFVGLPSPSGMKFCQEILETLSSHMVTLSHLGLKRYRDVTPIRTDRHQDRITIANTCYLATLALACKNEIRTYISIVSQQTCRLQIPSIVF